MSAPAAPSRRLIAVVTWREIITDLVSDYVRRFPEQCPVLVFPATAVRRRRAAAGGLVRT